MLNTYFHPNFGIPNHTLFFELNSEFKFVYEAYQADIIILGDYCFSGLEKIVEPHHVLIVPIIFHIDHHHTKESYYNLYNKVLQHITKKVITIHTNMNIVDDCNIIYYDHLFDRQKLYCTDYDRGINLNKRVWTFGCNKEIYNLHPIQKSPFKKFLAPMRVYYGGPSDKAFRMTYREKIKNFLFEKNDSFISNNSSANFLPNAVNSELLSLICDVKEGYWFPISNLYYDLSLVSVYTETLVIKGRGVRSITEKTFDPLIQGNFILPFGYPGLIKDILSYGFKLPNWIDYSYDTVSDDDSRFDRYIESLKKLNDYSLDELFNMAKNDLNILEHNRSIFYSRPYSYPLLADKIKSCIECNEANNWNY